jgi:hypothetical protein
MPWSWIATVETDLLILREDSVTRLAAGHVLIKLSKRFSVYHPYVPFSFGPLSEYSDETRSSTPMVWIPRNARAIRL